MTCVARLFSESSCRGWRRPVPVPKKEHDQTKGRHEQC